MINQGLRKLSGGSRFCVAKRTRFRNNALPRPAFYTTESDRIPNREASVDVLKQSQDADEEFDLLIIGGGSVGTGVYESLCCRLLMKCVDSALSLTSHGVVFCHRSLNLHICCWHLCCALNLTGAALDAAARGLKVACVERSDFGSGTSSRSTKLIWGGSRYLVS